ncbi:MAG: hypothetical protein ACXVC7_12965, partial [Bacteroidia bacterium]
IKAMSRGKTIGMDTLEVDLKLLVARYPKSDVTPLAQDILLSIKKAKNPDMFNTNPNKMPTDTFGVDFDSEHFLIAVVPDDPKIADAFKNNLNAFSTKYFSTKQFNMTSNLFTEAKQLIILKSFANAQEVFAYYDYLMNDKDVFKGTVKRELIEIYPISASNLPLLFKKKNLQGYALFYNDNYKKFIAGPK